MPAKKKKSVRSKSGSAAKQAELAYAAEAQRQTAEVGHLLATEDALRRLLRDEEARAIDSNRHHETDARNTIRQAELKAHYDSKEQQCLNAVQQMTAEVEELQKTLTSTQLARDGLEKEKESLQRRVALLANELELAQLNITEAEQRTTSADRQHHEAMRKLESEYDALQQSREELESRLAAAEAKLEQKVSEDPNAVSQDDAEPGNRVPVPTRDTETAALFDDMQRELNHYRAMAHPQQQAAAETAHERRADETSSMLVGVLNAQLEALREENTRLYELSQKHQSGLQAADEERQSAEGARREMQSQMEQALSAAAVQQRQLQLEMDAHCKEVERLSGDLSSLRDANTKLQQAEEEATAKAAHQAQADHATNVAMQAELANQKKDLQLALAAKQTAEDEKTKHKVLVRAEMDSLKIRLRQLQEAVEQKERDAFETMMVLKADLSAQQRASEQATDGLKDEVRKLQKQLLEVRKTNADLQAQLESTKKDTQQREQDLCEQLTHVSASRAAEQRKLEELHQRATEKEAAHTRNTICLNAECENLRSKLREMTETATQHRRTYLYYVEEMRVQTEQLQKQISSDAETQTSHQTKESARADLAERNVQRLQRRVQELNDAASKSGATHDEAVKDLQSENRELRGELSLAKRTVERLESFIGDQGGYYQLLEAHNKLDKDFEAAQRTVARLTDKVTVLQSEAATLGGYAVRKAQEEKEQLTRRLQQAERRDRVLAPLFKELRTIAEQRLTPYTHPDLFAALESLDREASVMPRRNASQDGGPAADRTDVGNVAAAAAADKVESQSTTTTVPVILKPRLPSAGSAVSVTPRKPRGTRVSLTVNGKQTFVPPATQERLPILS